MEKELNNNWIAFPRQIASDKRSGKLTHHEYQLFVWIRLNGNHLGVTSINIDALNEDVFENKSNVNAINKLLLSLKQKHYIYYERRSGRRGSFDVHLGGFILKDGSSTDLNQFFVDSKDHEKESTVLEIAEEQQSIPENEQRSESEKTLIDPKQIDDLGTTESRGWGKHNDNENYKNNRLHRKRTAVDTFKPDSSEESYCKDISICIGETNINFILSIYRKHGIQVLEQALGNFKLINSKRGDIKNKAAYFNSIVQSIVKNNST